MAHKVHPKVFRIRGIGDWLARGFYGKKIAKGLAEDFRIREFLNKKLATMAVEKIEIERSSGKINIIIASARPGLIIGRGGKGIEELKRELEKKIKSSASQEFKRELRIEIVEIKDPWTSASLSAQWIAQQIEKRLPYRRVLKGSLEKIIAHKQIQGARIEMAGRLDGSSIARREWLRKGQLPRNTIRADIDFATATAHCSYGSVGIKVWIYNGEKFDA